MNIRSEIGQPEHHASCRVPFVYDFRLRLRRATPSSAKPVFRPQATNSAVAMSSAGRCRRVSVGSVTDSTGKERDQETGLDYFGARYLSSAQGRWTIPDWSAKPEPVPYAKLDNPQSLNLYSYVHNNPLGRFDPDGHCTNGQPDDKGPCPPPAPRPPLLTETGNVSRAQVKPVSIGEQQAALQGPPPPERGATVGVGVAGNAEAGAGIVGAQVNGSAVVMASVGPSSPVPSLSAAASGAAVAYFDPHVAAAPKQPANPKPLVAGAYIGGGITFLAANTASGASLSGPFQTTSINLGAELGSISVTVSTDSTGTQVLQMTVGPGVGVSAWAVTTTTCVTGKGCR